MWRKTNYKEAGSTDASVNVSEIFDGSVTFIATEHHPSLVGTKCTTTPRRYVKTFQLN